MKLKHSRSSRGKIRIVGGAWRGRKISVADNATLRPTPDRVRETLFNWLKPVIDGKDCLDLFAGSGVLGFEALSRGARHVTMVEQDRETVAMLFKQAEILSADNIEIICSEANKFLAGSTKKFDIVFLDPPFTGNLLHKTCESLLNKGHLHSDSLVYVESESELTIEKPYRIIKQGSAGKVKFMLLETISGENINNDNRNLSGYI